MKKILSSVLWTNLIFIVSIYFWSVHKGFATDIEQLSYIVNRTLGYAVLLPVLDCHSKNSGYHRVTWYKDGVAVKSSSASLSGHVLSLGELLAQPFSDVFTNPLKLQGYYWCDIDLNFSMKTPEKYLFQIQDVHTYIGSIVAANDILLPSESNSELKNGKHHKRQLYENDLEDILFAFLPKPNTFVTDLNQTAKGLAVSFFLYDKVPIDPRQTSTEYRLNEDNSQMKYIMEYVTNKTDPKPDDEYLIPLEEWANQHGVSLADMKLKSTAGCYREISTNANKTLTWPYTAIGKTSISEEGCLTTAMLAVTRSCLGSFTTGAEWGPIEGVCNEYPQGRSSQLMDLLKHREAVGPSEEIRRLQMLTDNPKDLNVVDLHLVTSVLQDIPEMRDLSISDFDGIFSTINNVLHADSYNLNAAKRTLQLSSRLLDAINHVTISASIHNKEFTISKSSILAAAKGTASFDDFIVGVSVLPSEQWTSSPNGSVRFISNGSDVTAMQSVAGFVLPSDLIIKREETLSFPCQINMVYFSDWRLMSDPKEVLHYRNYEAVPAPVIRIGLSGGPAWNLSNPMRFYFKNDFHSDLGEKHKPVCTYFDTKLNNGVGGWATEGCSFEGQQHGYYVCHCHHISMVSIAVPRRPGYMLLFRPRSSIFIGCGLSIFILSLVILFYISSKTWRSNVNHHILFFLAVSTVCSLVLLLIHNVESQWGPGCMFLTIVFHYFVQVTFCWLLVQALVHHTRFCKNIEIDDMGKFLIRSSVFAWDFPFIIVAITWVVKGSVYYHHKVCWATMIEISSIIFYPVVLLLLLTLCFNAIAAYCLTCRKLKDFELKRKTDGEYNLKFKVALSIFCLFFLSWLFGYLSLHKKPAEFQILFGIAATVTSLYIFLFFVFHDISPIDLYEKMRASERKQQADSTDALSSPDAKTYNATTYNATQ